MKTSRARVGDLFPSQPPPAERRPRPVSIRVPSTYAAPQARADGPVAPARAPEPAPQAGSVSDYAGHLWSGRIVPGDGTVVYDLGLLPNGEEAL